MGGRGSSGSAGLDAGIIDAREGCMAGYGPCLKDGMYRRRKKQASIDKIYLESKETLLRC